MTGFVTPAQARETLPCPMARTFAEKKGPNCDADKCPVWRWLPLPATDPSYMSAVKREEACLAQEAEKETGKPQNADKFHKVAVSNVRKNPVAYGVQPKHGFCGLGGRPEQ
jgi:hypothetical protein